MGIEYLDRDGRSRHVDHFALETDEVSMEDRLDELDAVKHDRRDRSVRHPARQYPSGTPACKRDDEPPAASKEGYTYCMAMDPPSTSMSSRMGPVRIRCPLRLSSPCSKSSTHGQFLLPRRKVMHAVVRRCTHDDLREAEARVLGGDVRGHLAAAPRILRGRRQLLEHHFHVSDNVVRAE